LASLLCVNYQMYMKHARMFCNCIRMLTFPEAKNSQMLHDVIVVNIDNTIIKLYST